MVSKFCCLRAQNLSKTLDRRYSLYLSRDLFGGWMLITQGEREGRKGQGKRYTFTDEEAAQKKFQQILKRWINTQKRNGCDYQIVEEGQAFQASRKKSQSLAFVNFFPGSIIPFNFPSYTLLHQKSEDFRRTISFVLVMSQFLEGVMSIFRHARLHVASGHGALSQATQTTFFFFDLRETQRRSSRHLRLGRQRIPNLAPVNEGPQAITE